MSSTGSAGEPYHTHCERKIDASKQTELQRDVRSYMDSVVFPEVSLSGVPFQDAVEWVQKRISEHAPASVPADRSGISITLVPRQTVREPVTISLRSATLPQILDAICAQHHYVWCVEPSALSIIPRERLITR